MKAQETRIEYVTTVEYVVKVSASSSDLSEQELRQVVAKAVKEDLAHDSASINGQCGSRVASGKGCYGYRYEAIEPTEDLT